MTVFLVLTGMLHLSVASHYCGGNLAASKISFSGDLASCGMEGAEESCPLDHSGGHMKSHCCEDVLTSYSIDNNYTPATNAGSGILSAKYPVPDLSYISPARFPDIKSQSWSDTSPPGLFMTSSVELSDIRVLRI